MSSNNLKKVRLGDIIVDPTYQVRKKLRTKVVNEYAYQMANGEHDNFPPIVILNSYLK